MSKPLTRVRAVSLVDPNAPGIVSAYDFRRTATKGSFEDLVGSNDGTAVGGLDFVKDRWGTGVRVDQNGVIDLGTGFNTQTDFFASFLYTHYTTGSLRFLLSQYRDANNGFALVVNSNALSVYDDISNAGTSRYSETLVNGVTYHVVFGINDANLCKLWVNGVAADNDESAAAGFETVGGNLYVGSRYNLNLWSIPGTISNVEIYNTDLTDADVSAIYNRGKNIKSFFDRGITASGSTIASGFIDNSHIEISSGSFKIDSDASGKYLEGVTDGQSKISTAELGFDVVNTAYGTWDFWVYKEDADVTKIAFVENSFGILSSGYHLELDASENVKIVETGVGTVVTGSSSLTAGSWQNIRITRNYAGLFTLYLDGASIGTGTDTTTTRSRSIGFELDAGSRVGLTGDYAFWYSPTVQAP